MTKQEIIEKYGIEAYEVYKKERAQYAREHKEEQKRWQQTNKEKVRNIQRKRYATQKGRAYDLWRTYKRFDEQHGYENNLTPEWIIENIFNHKCYWCGESDWRKMGCDRIDNTKGHTMDNVIPSCSNCNVNRGKKSFDQYTLTKERISDDPEYRKLQQRNYYETHKEKKIEVSKKWAEKKKLELGEDGWKKYKHDAYLKRRDKAISYQIEYNKKKKEMS